MPRVTEQNVLNSHWFCATLTAVPLLLAAIVVLVSSLRLN